MTNSSPSPPDIASLSLSPQRTQPPHDLYDYDGSNGRLAYHYQTSPPLIPGQSLYSNSSSLNVQHTPIKPSKPSRAGLPSQWLDNQPSQFTDARSLSPPDNSELSSGGGSPPPMSNINSQSFQSTGGIGDDEIIPTAIVIKNIPFNVKKETLLDIIASLSIPTPYAFNYHLDPAGSFRGLAFANFRLPGDADAVVAALNGFDVQGRKLRVEYKKVLQAGEKERIEREKAIRRMRSMQLEKEHQQHQPPPPPPVAQQYDDFGPSSGVFTPRSYTGGGAIQSPPFQQHSPPQMQPLPSRSFLASPPQIQQTPTKAPSSNTELDLNDASTLEIYSRILLFKDDHMRDELAFSRTLSPKQRRVVHLVAQKLGVYHYSVGEGDERYAVVTRIDPETRQQHAAPPRHTAQTLSRASSSYLSTATQSINVGLRSKKSMPDMKTLHTAGPRLSGRASNGNLREYATIASPSRRTPGGFGSLFGNGGGAFGNMGSNIPPVPSLPAGLSNGLNDGPIGGVVRQPRGPGEGGFGQRRASAATGESRGLEARSHEPLEI